RAAERNLGCAEALVTVGAREANRIASIALAEPQERAEKGIADENGHVRFATCSQDGRYDRLAELLVFGLESFERATRVARERVVTNRIDRVGENRVGGGARACAGVEAGERFDVVLEIAARWSRIRWVHDARLGPELGEL